MSELGQVRRVGGTAAFAGTHRGFGLSIRDGRNVGGGVLHHRNSVAGTSPRGRAKLFRERRLERDRVNAERLRRSRQDVGGGRWTWGLLAILRDNPRRFPEPPGDLPRR